MDKIIVIRSRLHDDDLVGVTHVDMDLPYLEIPMEMKHPDHIANSAEAPPPAEPARDFPDWRGAHKHELAALEKRVEALEATVANLVTMTMPAPRD